MIFKVEPFKDDKFLIWVNEDQAIKVSDDELSNILRLRDNDKKFSVGRPKKNQEIVTKPKLSEKTDIQETTKTATCKHCGHIVKFRKPIKRSGTPCSKCRKYISLVKKEES